MHPAPDHAVTAEGLVKRYGATRALDGLDLAVPRGTVMALLGPNGAGKTTAVEILATLRRPDAGRAVVAGHDVARRPDRVRERIGLTGQFAAVDEILTGRENLVMFARLSGLGAAGARRRADDLLERFGLTGAAGRPAGRYSGGMRRRLDLAASLTLDPQVLFLDEPTTGLDPRSRNGVWAAVRDLAGRGTTVLLTTQYLEEADRLADRMAVIDSGRVIAEGTAEELKSAVGGDRVDVVLEDAADLGPAAAVLGRVCGGAARVDTERRRVSAPVSAADRIAALTGAVRELDAAGVRAADIGLRRPTLDDVFLSLTGHTGETAPVPDAPRFAPVPAGQGAGA
ncbi:ATP-binding cassette domain-containing protein [Streptomonospora nanhaiensis]|uniref:ATP-binding cassette domain-containing protein n=1 Tax=Streptomonospora nanhaiensis TaxID=1323731 RepID=UPI001C39388B|nr:ATP-binding cassette domain-containing protein [Streptomonospora nanhaiensis]MBV2363758.1 ATP-binding cassette domain-containing protein [Streptomonospora nanhaiensis]